MNRDKNQMDTDSRMKGVEVSSALVRRINWASDCANDLGVTLDVIFAIGPLFV